MACGKNERMKSITGVFNRGEMIRAADACNNSAIIADHMQRESCNRLGQRQR